MKHFEALKDAFRNIGIAITEDDMPMIMTVGADQFISAHSCPVNEESLAGIYIIMTEAKQGQSLANDL